MSLIKTKVLQDGMTRIIEGLGLRKPTESLYLDGQITIRVEKISEYDAGNSTVLLSVRGERQRDKRRTCRVLFRAAKTRRHTHS